MNKKKMGLGRGLGTLMTEKQEEVETKPEIISESSDEILIEFIETNPFQPRTSFDPTALNELKDSILMQGIIQPITVRKINETRYQLISGERRLQASKLAGLKKMPAYVKEVNDTQMLEMGLIENIQRENLNPMEVAKAYQRLIIECKLKQEELGLRVGKDRSTVNNFLRLLNLPVSIQEGLQDKKLSMGHARALLGINNESQMLEVYQQILTSDLSVRKVEEIAKQINLVNISEPLKKSTAQKSKPKLILSAVQDKLKNVFNKNVSVIADAKNNGEIKISFGSKEDLDQIIEKLKK